MAVAAQGERGAVGGRIPVVILAGFLGSGKTTLLNHLLRRSRGTRIGAVVNDFGSIEIDAMTVAGQVDSMVSLGDGCLCCAVDTDDLDEVLDVLARPSAGMDVLVIEASGIAEPETLIRMVLASDCPHIVYGGLVEVVDAAEFDAVRARHPELERHVSAADLLVLNKADRVAGPRLDALRAELGRLGPGTPVVTAEHGRVDPALLFDRVRRERPPVEQLSFDVLLYGEEDGEDAGTGEDDGSAGVAGDEQAAGGAESGREAGAAGCAAHGDGCHGEHGAHLHAAYESVEFDEAAPMDPRRFLDFLDSRPDGLYRIKGFVDFGAADPAHRYEVHAVGGFLRFAPLDRTAGEERRTRLVLIGAGVDGAALRAGLAACVADGTAPGPGSAEAAAGGVDPAMWGVLRYVDRRPGGPGDAGAEPADATDAFAEPDDLPDGLPGDLRDDLPEAAGYGGAEPGWADEEDFDDTRDPVDPEGLGDRVR